MKFHETKCYVINEETFIQKFETGIRKIMIYFGFRY